jgi:hypothetical protein
MSLSHLSSQHAALSYSGLLQINFPQNLNGSEHVHWWQKASDRRPVWKITSLDAFQRRIVDI